MALKVKDPLITDEGNISKYTDMGGGKGLVTPVETAPPPKPPEEETTDDHYSGGGVASAPTAKAVPSSLQGTDQTRALYDQALAALSTAEQGRPEWNGSAYDADIDRLYAQISGRGDFQYRLNDDALWQMLKDQHTQAGKAAMRDTMGQAAALTGGYGSSYGQAVGQQAYDRSIESLMEMAPELEERAYQRWQSEGDALTEQLGLARTLASDEYGKWQDEYGLWADERGYARDAADDAYEKWLYEREYEDSAAAKNYQKVVSYISLGYTPTDQELADAGISPDQFKALWNAYAPKKSGGGGGGGTDYGAEYDELMAGAKQTMKDAGLKAAGRIEASASSTKAALNDLTKLLGRK